MTATGESKRGKSFLQTSWLYSIPLTINYEDTDAGGVVYYGNYLGYMERARNAYLRSLGYPLGKLEVDHQILFVVNWAGIKYLSPAKLDDELLVTLGVSKVGGADVIFEHQVLRQEECLVCGEIRVVVINSQTFKPTRIPPFLRESLSVLS